VSRARAAALGLVLLLLGTTTCHAQSAAVARIGYVSLASVGSSFQAFRDGLRELGYVEGRNVLIEARFAEGRAERLPDLVAELVARDVDVLVVNSTATAVAAKRATSTLPIVFVSVIDPVAAGLVASLARPGGNLTGLTGWVGGAGFAGKWIELLKEAVPDLAHVAVLANPANPQTARQLQELHAAARSLRVTMDVLDAKDVASLERMLASLGGGSARGLVVAGDPLFTANRSKIIAVASRHRLPAVYFYRLFADAGGLMAYGARSEDTHRAAASYVHKILKGAKPADLPVEQPTRFELTLNRRTARALGLTLPQALLLRADHIID